MKAADTSGAAPRALIGVCTYEEAANIETLLAGLRRALPHADVVVIDDNSPDGTAEIAQRLADGDPAIRVIIRRDQRGLGSAIVLAASRAIADDYEYFLNLDGDLSHDPADLPRLLTAITAQPDIDVVVGSRYVPGGKIEGWPQRRRWMSWLVNRFAVICLRLPVRDCSGSIRCYRVSALRRVDLSRLRCQGYALLEELLVRLKQQGSKMAEVPITFTDRQQGHSKLTIGEALRSITFMVRLALMPRTARKTSEEPAHDPHHP